jgi:hypothetical protein
MIRYTLVLILASLLPTVLGLSGWLSAAGALLLGAGFLRGVLPGGAPGVPLVSGVPVGPVPPFRGGRTPR